MHQTNAHFALLLQHPLLIISKKVRTSPNRISLSDAIPCYSIIIRMTHLGLGFDGGLFRLLLFLVHFLLQLGQFGSLLRFLFELLLGLDRGLSRCTIFHRIGHGDYCWVADI